MILDRRSLVAALGAAPAVALPTLAAARAGDAVIEAPLDSVFERFAPVGLGAALVSRADDADDEPSAGVFWIHMASYGLNNALIGYLLTNGEAKTGTKLGKAKALGIKVITEQKLLKMLPL